MRLASPTVEMAIDSSNGDAVSPAAPGRRYRALVVDDERDFRHLMTIFLRRSGLPIDVEAVSNGAEALRQVDVNPPDLILLDVTMPEIDGFEVCRRLRADDRTRAIPILILTGLDEVADRTRGILADTDDYLGKPFDRCVLLERVRRILRRTYGYDGVETTSGGLRMARSA